MKNYLLFLLFIHAFNLSSQTNSIKDYNQDGIKDTLRYQFYDERGRTYIYDMEFIDGASHEKYPFYESEYSRSDFISIISIPDFLMEKRNEEALDTARKLLNPKYKNSDINPSFEWLVDAYNTNEYLDANLYFDQFMQVEPKWYDLPVKYPDVSYHLIDTTILKLPDYFYPDKKYKYAWLTYYGHNHKDQMNDKSFDEIKINNSTTILSTQHGLILKKKNKYTWLFHSNSTLTGGPGKLRWKSIEDVLIHKRYIFIHHISPVIMYNQVFVIDCKTGKVGKIKLGDWFSENSFDRFNIDFIKGELFISHDVELDEDEDGNKYELKVFKLKTIIKELNKL